MGDPDYEPLIQAVVDAMMVVDRDGLIRSANAGASHLFRCHEDELIGLRVEDLIPPRLRKAHQSLRSQYQDHPQPRLMGSGLETPGYRRDGSEFPAEISLSPIPDGRTLVSVVDITKRQQDSGDLRKFSRVVEQTASSIVITDRQGNIEYVNPSFVKSTGYSAQEVTGQRPNFLKSGHTTEGEYQHLWQTINDGQVWHGHFHNRRKDGSLFWESVIISPIRDDEGTITHFAAIKDDITDAKIAKDALREREEQLRLFIEHAPVALAMFDLNMCYLSASRRWQLDYGLKGQHIIGRSHYDIFPEIGERWRAVHRRCLAGHVESMAEDHFERTNGMTQWLRWEARPWRTGNGEIGGVVIFTEDITTRIHDRDAMSQIEQRFRATFDQAAVGMAHVGLDGRWLRVNQKLCDMVGYSHDELLQRSFQSITHPADLDADLVQLAALLNGEIDHYSMEKRYIRQDGQAIWILLTGSLLKDESGQAQYFIAVIQDIDDSKRAEGTLRRLRGDLEQALALHVATQTAAAIAHDLNQPLNAIASYTEAALRMLQSGAPKPDRMLHALQSASQQAQRAGDVMRELMQFLYKGEPPPTEAFDLNAVVQEAVASVQVRSDEPFLVETVLKTGLRPIQASRIQVERVMINLLSNALEAMQSIGAQPQAVTITITTTQDHDMAMVTVQDCGPGLDAETAQRAFEPFFTTKDQGLGMGLAVSRALIQANGGQLWCENMIPSGAAFHFTLPLAQ